MADLTDQQMALSIPDDEKVRVASRTYFWLRIFLSGFALSLPVVLSLWAYSQEKILGVGYSISGYYHCRQLENGDSLFSLLGTPLMVGDFLVGVLCAVGVLLMIYQGLTPWEDWLLNVGGVAICCVALFACGDSEYPKNTEVVRNDRAAAELELGRGVALPVVGQVTSHGISAGVFFAAIAGVAVLSGVKSWRMLEDGHGKRGYTSAYVILAACMVAIPITTWVLLAASENPGKVFMVETAGVLCFAAYWIVRTFEFLGDSGRQRQMYMAHSAVAKS